MKKIILLNLGLALVSQLAFAAPKPVITTAWKNPECDSGNCDLKGMKLFIQKNNDNRLAGNFMSAEIETTRPEALKNYVFVQYIQGCLYETDSKGNATIGTREFFRKASQPFHHKEMEVDSGPDLDPVYNSNQFAGYDELRGFDVPRNSDYVTKNPLTEEGYGGWSGKIKNLKGNKIYASDYPTMSGFDLTEDMKVIARNASLKFKICLHHVNDVPKVGTSTTVAANPITCMDWSSNYEYNFKTRKINEKAEISPVCK